MANHARAAGQLFDDCPDVCGLGAIFPSDGVGVTGATVNVAPARPATAERLTSRMLSGQYA